MNNYLRTARRRAGLSQDEVALLLGKGSGDTVSRHENYTRTPSVPTVFAYEVIFRANSRELFAGAYEQVRRSIIARSKTLITALSCQSGNTRALRKLRYLESIVEGEQHNQKLP